MTKNIQREKRTMPSSSTSSFALNWVAIAVVGIAALVDGYLFIRGDIMPWYHWCLLAGVLCMAAAPMVRARSSRISWALTTGALLLILAGFGGAVRPMWHA
jgi:hypothetical protein